MHQKPSGKNGLFFKKIPSPISSFWYGLPFHSSNTFLDLSEFVLCSLGSLKCSQRPRIAILEFRNSFSKFQLFLASFHIVPAVDHSFILTWTSSPSCLLSSILYNHDLAWKNSFKVFELCPSVSLLSGIAAPIHPFFFLYVMLFNVSIVRIRRWCRARSRKWWNQCLLSFPSFSQFRALIPISMHRHPNQANISMSNQCV